MKTEIKKLNDAKIEIAFEVSWDEFLPHYDKAVLKLAENLNVPGFRHGKAPKEIIIKHLDEQKIMMEAAESAVRKKYSDYVLENKLEIVGLPEIEITKLAKENPFCFRARADIAPEIKLPDYKKIAAGTKRTKTFSVEEKEIEASLKWLRQSRAEFEESKEQIKRGNFLEIEYQSPSLENNKVFQDGFICGESHFIPGFEDNLLGMKTGEKKDFEVKFPDDYKNKNLAGKNIPFKVEIKKIQNMKLPELTDEFAKKLGDFEDFAALKEKIRKDIEQEKISQERQKIRKEILENIAKETEIEIPQSLIEHEQEHMFEELKNKIEDVFKRPFGQYLEELKKTEREIKDSFRPEAEKRIKEALILKKIGEKENVAVKQEEVASAINETLKNFPEPEKIKELDPERLRDYYKEVIFNEKVLKLLENYVSHRSNYN